VGLKSILLPDSTVQIQKQGNVCKLDKQTMTEETKKASEDKSDAEKVRIQSSAKAIDKVDKNLLIEKQNIVGKRLLRLLPFQIFILVADADGKTDNKEVAQFREFLNLREKNCSNPYTRRMFHSTVVNYTALTNRYLGGQIVKDFKIIQKAMKYMQMIVSPTVMASICKDLRELAVAIAEASGGFLGMTTSISDEETNVIEKLDKIFKQAVQLANGDDAVDGGQLDF
jgi:tellurite resistance protein